MQKAAPSPMSKGPPLEATEIESEIRRVLNNQVEHLCRPSIISMRKLFSRKLSL
jgi:hypothetical protein